MADASMTLTAPVLPADVLAESYSGNIRRAQHFVTFLQSVVEYLRRRLETRQVEKENPQTLLAKIVEATAFSPKMMKHTRHDSRLCFAHWKR